MITNALLGQTGRLGNQMFEYALLLGVASKCRYELAIPKLPDKPGRIVQYELKYLQVTARTLPKNPPITNQFHLRRYEFDPNVFKQPDGTDFYGGFQSERYFQHCEKLVRSEFRLRRDIDAWAQQEIAKYKEYDEVVALSVRRGDYLQHQPRFQLLNARYYEWAMSLLEEQLGSDCCYLIFSDDLPWCKANLKPQSESEFFYPKYPSHWHQLALMTKCDHHILAASSFSWWGAWLAKTAEQLVIAPDPWLGPRPSGKPENCEDVYAANWHRLSIADTQRAESPWYRAR